MKKFFSFCHVACIVRVYMGEGIFTYHTMKGLYHARKPNP